MAADQALLESAESPVLRIYRWTEPSVTIGYAQNLARIREALPPWPVVRRWTGGGVVLHGEDRTYSLIVPAACDWARTRTLDSYRLVHGGLAAALAGAGHEGCRLATQEDVVDDPFCFVAPAVHDVVRGPAKIAGAGQRRSKIGFLHQGSVQGIALDDGFFEAWANQLADKVTVVRDLADSVAERAAVLRETRYSAESWLLEREDAR